MTLEENQTSGRRTRKIRIHILFLGLVILCSLVILSLWQYIQFAKSMKNNSHVLLLDITKSEITPVPGQSIFFHKNSWTEKQDVYVVSLLSIFIPRLIQVYRARLTAYEACAVESAALHNPQSEVYMLFSKPTYWMDNSTDMMMKTVLSYPNVRVRQVNMETYMKETPISSWLNRSNIYGYGFLEEHNEDIIRFLSLWHYGGLTLDLDTVTLRSYENLKSNYFAINSKTNELELSILNLAPTGLGHSLMKKCLKNMELYLYVHDKGDNCGREILTDLLEQICPSKNFTENLAKQNCNGFQVIGPEKFHPAPKFDKTHKSEEDFVTALTKYEGQLYATYGWKRFLRRHPYKRNFSGSYAWLAMKNCPKVYALLNRFESERP